MKIIDLGDVLNITIINIKGIVETFNLKKEGLNVQYDTEKDTIIFNNKTTIALENIEEPVVSTMAELKTAINAMILSGNNPVSATLTGVPVNAVANQGLLEISGGIEFQDTVLIGDKTYTFKDAFNHPTEGIKEEGDVYFGPSTKEALENLLNAINHTGTEGVDYICASAHPDVVAISHDTSTLLVEDKIKGAEGSGEIVLDAQIVGTSSSWTTSKLEDGVYGTIGKVGQIYISPAKNYAYIATANNTIYDANWRKYSLSTL